MDGNPEFVDSESTNLSYIYWKYLSSTYIHYGHRGLCLGIRLNKWGSMYVMLSRAVRLERIEAYYG